MLALITSRFGSRVQHSATLLLVLYTTVQLKLMIIAVLSIY